MWDDAEGDLFTRYRQQTESFIRRSRARAFLSEQAGTLRSVRAAVADIADVKDMQTWLEREFTARPGPMQVYVSPITGGWNFTNLDPVTPRLWVPAAKPQPTPYQRATSVRSIFTEVDHHFVNPVTSRLPSRDYSFMTDRNGWASSEAWAGYDTPELVANEYMTWATYLFYARERLSGDDLKTIESKTTEMMETRRGFSKFGLFMSAMTSQRERLRAPLEACYHPALLILNG